MICDYGPAGGGFEVEFIDELGKTYALVALPAHQLMLPHQEPVHEVA